MPTNSRGITTFFHKPKSGGAGDPDVSSYGKFKFKRPLMKKKPKGKWDEEWYVGQKIRR